MKNSQGKARQGEAVYYGYTEAARTLGTSRQNVQQFLERSGRLGMCGRIGSKHHAVVIIPKRYLEDAPFVTGQDHGKRGRPWPKKPVVQ